MARSKEEKAAYDKAWRVAYYRTEKGLAYMRAANKRARQRNHDYIKAIKENATCMDCGVKYPYYVYDFDHREPCDKDDVVSRVAQRGVGIPRLQAELDKCDIVCSNCHRERTHRWRLETGRYRERISDR